jgi:hypothetical protein
MIDQIIENLVQNPTDDEIEKYEKHVNFQEIQYLKEAETYKFKSQEYFDTRRKAFAYRKECAIKLINSWVDKFKTSEGCPVQYRDTLNLVFTQISAPST